MKYIEILQSGADLVLYSRFHLTAKEMGQKSFHQNNRGLKNSTFK